MNKNNDCFLPVEIKYEKKVLHLNKKLNSWDSINEYIEEKEKEKNKITQLVLEKGVPKLIVFLSEPFAYEKKNDLSFVFSNNTEEEFCLKILFKVAVVTDDFPSYQDIEQISYLEVGSKIFKQMMCCKDKCGENFNFENYIFYITRTSSKEKELEIDFFVHSKIGKILNNKLFSKREKINEDILNLNNDYYMFCSNCKKTLPFRFQPSPDAGPFWRCSECGDCVNEQRTF